MTESNRYYPRFFGKGENLQELYEVADSRTRESLSAPKPYHEVLAEVEARNAGTFEPAAAWTVAIPHTGSWVG